MPRKIDSYFSPILYYWSEVSFPIYEMWAHILLPSQSILLCIRWDRECQYTLKIIFLYWNLRDLSLVVRMANGRAPGTNKLPLVVTAGRSGLRRILRPNPGWWLARTVWPEKKQWNHCLPPPHLVTPAWGSASVGASPQSLLWSNLFTVLQLVTFIQHLAGFLAPAWHSPLPLALGSLRKLGVQSFAFSEF